MRQTISKHDLLTTVEETRHKQGRGLPEPEELKRNRQAHREATLLQIEEVLDNLNESTAGIVRKGSSHGANIRENISRMKTFAKPNTGITGLVDMINEVIDGLEE